MKESLEGSVGSRLKSSSSSSLLKFCGGISSQVFVVSSSVEESRPKFCGVRRLEKTGARQALWKVMEVKNQDRFMNSDLTCYLILLIVLIVVVIGISVLTSMPLEVDTKVIHERCKNDCGDGLVCDPEGTCKIKALRPCANDGDCTLGLRCVNWICSTGQDPYEIVPVIKPPRKKKSTKSVKFPEPE